jgi:molybdopterin-synthase adenylyltransferase
MVSLDSLQQTRRYSRQIMLPAVDLAGQEKLLNSKVLLVGMGGLGCAAAPYLCSGGVGQLTLVDGDTIDLTNLQRQILYRDEDVGRFKAETAANWLSKQNPDSRIHAICQFADAKLLADLVDSHDLVLDCTDNLAIRQQISDACVVAKKPLISAAAIRFEGQLCCFKNDGNGPCYRCVSSFFGEQHLTCLDAGIFAPVVGLVGVQQALWAMLWLSGAQDLPWHQLSGFTLAPTQDI